MKSKVKRKTPEIVLREGKPSAVILDIDEYRQTLCLTHFGWDSALFAKGRRGISDQVEWVFSSCLCGNR